MNVGLEEVKLKTCSSIPSGEMLEVSMRLGANPITFRGRVLYVTPSRDPGFELGISIEEMEDKDRIALTRFVIEKWRLEGI